MGKLKSIEELNNLRLLLKEETFPEGKERIRACTGTACMATGANRVIERIEERAREAGLDLQVRNPIQARRHNHCAASLVSHEVGRRL